MLQAQRKDQEDYGGKELDLSRTVMMTSHKNGHAFLNLKVGSESHKESETSSVEDPSRPVLHNTSSSY